MALHRSIRPSVKHGLPERAVTTRARCLRRRPVDRLKDPSTIEHRLLELAHTTDAKITAPALAYFAPCSLDDATRVLDELTTHDRLSMEIEDDGAIVYQMFGRQKLTARPAQTALVRVERRDAA